MTALVHCVPVYGLKPLRLNDKQMPVNELRVTGLQLLTLLTDKQVETDSKNKCIKCHRHKT